MESRIQLKPESGITLTIGIQDLSCTDQEAGIQHLADPESTAWNRLSWIPIHGTSHRSSYLNVSSSFCFISEQGENTGNKFLLEYPCPTTERYKLLVVGDDGCGKTSLLNALVKSDFDVSVSLFNIKLRFLPF